MFLEQDLARKSQQTRLGQAANHMQSGHAADHMDVPELLDLLADADADDVDADDVDFFFPAFFFASAFAFVVFF